ncbi:cytidylyltransferase domain-containing protein [Bhargavaea cecembensis]|nr:glycosyltransferase [Bhargavaea cecembensis]
MDILAIIPARGGSKGIPRKNVRLLVGKPLISYSIQNALNSKYSLDVVVSTDDEEIERISNQYGASVLIRPTDLASDDVTLDPVIYHAVKTFEQKRNKTYDIVITMQPTSPLLTTKTLDSAIEYFIKNDFDTVLSGVNKPHLAWTEKDGKVIPLYQKRLNRQYLPKNLLETGAFFISKRKFIDKNNRFGPEISVFDVPENESIDIDSSQDWWVAEKELSKKKILIRVEGYAEIGLGHIYRGLLLAYNFIDHNVCFVLSSQSDLGIEKIKQSHFQYKVIDNNNELYELLKLGNYDILVNDMLDTNSEYIKKCKEMCGRVVNFEDLGAGAALADAVINDLYDKKNDRNNHYWGSDYYCIRDEFLIAEPSKFKEEVKEVLVIFGGTDPSNLTQRVLNIVESINKSDIHYTFILGMGYAKADELINSAQKDNLNVDFVKDVKLMSEYMANADIAISSQGRTMLELASMSVPTILLAQNEREQHHEFGYLKNGFINLGLGKNVDNNTIRETLLWLINSPQIRKQMKEQMEKKDLRLGIERVKNIILNKHI